MNDSNPETPVSQSAASPGVSVEASTGFVQWLERIDASIAFTTYQTNRLFLMGRGPSGFTGTERLLDRPMGLATSADRIDIATRSQIWRFEDVLGGDVVERDHDRIYSPRSSHLTGEVDVHDIARLPDGRLLFVNTLYSCLATLDERHSFVPYWKPPFISRLAPEDRCHLNGVAMENGAPRFVTAASRSDVHSGWRDRRHDGGVVVDVTSGEIVTTGLSMPHSPRLYRGELWVLNSGYGTLGRIDLSTGAFEPLAFAPGYLRGLVLIDGYALVGLSLPRDRTFQGLPLDAELQKRDALPRCGLSVIELTTGHVVHHAHIGGVVSELYDVALLPGVRSPGLVGFRGNELRTLVHFADPWESDAPGEADSGHPTQTRHRLRATEADTEVDGAPLPRPPAAISSPAAVGATLHEAETRDATPVRPPVGTAPTPRISPMLAQLLSNAPNGISVREVPTDLAAQNAFLTFPDIRQTGLTRPLPPNLIGAVAIVASQPVGAALAEVRADGNAELLSLRVLPGHRQQGYGKGLLQAMEAALEQRGVPEIGLTFRTHWKQLEALKHILATRGWSPGNARRLLVKMDTTLPADFLSTPRLPAGWEIVDWDKVNAAERERIRRRGEQGWYVEGMSPFQLADRVVPETSLWLRRHGEVVAWIVTHQAGPQTLQFTSLFADASARRARSLTLLQESVRRALASRFRRAIFMIDIDNQPMTRVFERRLKPFAVETAEMCWSLKRLNVRTS